MMLTPPRLEGVNPIGGFPPDTPPWALPEKDINMGTGGSWLSIGIRFGVSSGFDRGTLVYFTAAAGLADVEAGTYHEDEPSAVFVGSDFEIWVEQNGGSEPADNGAALETWHSLQFQRDFFGEISGAGTHTMNLYMKLRDASTLDILAQGQVNITGIRT